MKIPRTALALLAWNPSPSGIGMLSGHSGVLQKGKCAVLAALYVYEVTKFESLTENLASKKKRQEIHQYKPQSCGIGAVLYFHDFYPLFTVVLCRHCSSETLELTPVRLVWWLLVMPSWTWCFALVAVDSQTSLVANQHYLSYRQVLAVGYFAMGHERAHGQ